MTLLLTLTAIPVNTVASSHAEAPLISMDRFADNTDTYAFRSVEPGREGFVTLIANYIPLQDPSAGPQWFRFDDTVLYERSCVRRPTPLVQAAPLRSSDMPR